MRRSCAMRGDGSPSTAIHAEFFPVETTNARCNVGYLTFSIPGAPGDARRREIEAFAGARNGIVQWRVNLGAGRSYALLCLPDASEPAKVAAAPGESVYDGAVIGWAVFPAVTEALPQLLDALGGPGRPAGVMACRPCEGGVILEWDPAVCGAAVVSALVDAELRRFNSGRTAQLLSPLPSGVVAQIAAQGLQAPEISTERILEILIRRA